MAQKHSSSEPFSKWANSLTYFKSPKDTTVTYSSITDIHNEASQS